MSPKAPAWETKSILASALRGSEGYGLQIEIARAAIDAAIIGALIGVVRERLKMFT
jgi:hypothetical protein